MQFRAVVGYVIAAGMAAIILASGLPVGAQIPTPLPSLSPSPIIDLSPSPSPSPSPSSDPAPPAPEPTRSAPQPQPSPSTEVPSQSSGGQPAGGLVIPNLARTPSRTTARLLEIVAPLTDRGIPLETAMIRAAPPFPVAGFSWFTDDFMFPRYAPVPHLHEGTDIFADMGTPIVASEPGTVAAMATTSIGGNSLWMVGESLTTYYYSHLIGFAEGLQVGQRVEGGSVIGYVGNTGNAITTPPHVHFEVHPPVRDRRGQVVAAGVAVAPNGVGQSLTPAVNPKPYLDQWLAQAEERAQSYVVELVRQLGAYSRQIHFSRRVEELYQVEEVARPRELFWFSFIDPGVAAIGLARDSASSALLRVGSGRAGQSTDDQILAAVRLAVQAPRLRVGTLMGGFDRTAAPGAAPAG